MANSDQVGAFLTEWVAHSERRLEYARSGDMGVAAVLDFLYEEGFAWRDLSSMSGVDRVKMTRWRVKKLGTKDVTPSFTDSELESLSKLAGMCDVLLSEIVNESMPAAWFEVPFNQADCPLTPMDVYKAGRFDLLAAYAFDKDGVAILDEFDPQWRERYATCWEVFEAEDGWLSIRMKS